METNNPPEFKSLSGCTNCPLHDNAKNPGIPTRPAYTSDTLNRALLIVGEAPGYNEDQEGISWVGQAGHILDGFICKSALPTYTDIYLSNCCRCLPPFQAGLTTGQANKCRPHLQADYQTLCKSYPQVDILCCGRWGTESVTKLKSLKSGLLRQGKLLSQFSDGIKAPLTHTDTTRVFFTYHPAALSPSRKASAIPAVVSHFQLLQRYFADAIVPCQLQIEVEQHAYPPTILPPIVCVDIETYGILKGQQQTVFQPAKSKYIDKVSEGDQIVTVCLGYQKVPEDKEIPFRTVVLDWKKDRLQIRSWIHAIANQGCILLGQNIKFDVQSLRFNDHLLQEVLVPGNITLDDTMLWSFLLYEQRPERGLKELALLFGLSDYTDHVLYGKDGGTALSSTDPKLLEYNCLDVATTLALREYALIEIRKKYGHSSYKLTSNCAKMRNYILWDVIMLETTGVAVDMMALRKYNKELKDILSTTSDTLKDTYEIKITGKGSKKSLTTFFVATIEELALTNDSRLTYTEKRHDLSLGVDNRKFLLGEAEPGTEAHDALLLIDKHTGLFKLYNTYTQKLLKDPRKGVVHKNFIFPEWYPIPARIGKEESPEGGTIQGRFAAKKPAVQTFPPEIKKLLTSRYSDGLILGYDMSQVELRMSGLLSGDPVIIQEYEDEIDRHMETACLIFPEADSTSDTFWEEERMVGKKLNFLTIYRGGAQAFQDVVLKDLGIYIPIERCRDSIARFDRKYRVFREWQDKMILAVAKIGYFELPTGWSRYFGTGEMARSCVCEICNFPIQTLSAQMLECAQYLIVKDLRRFRLKATLVMQIHDALYLDLPQGEVKKVDEIMNNHLLNNPVLGIISTWAGHTIPFAYEKKILTPTCSSGQQ